jgi:hypothetical protein
MRADWNLEAAVSRVCKRQLLANWYSPLTIPPTICLLTYLLTPRSRVLLEKLRGFQLVKKFPPFYGTQKFITVVTCAHHLSLHWASLIQSMPPHPTSWRSITLLSSHLCLGLPNGLSLKFPYQIPVYASSLPHTRYMPRPSHSQTHTHKHTVKFPV